MHQNRAFVTGLAMAALIVLASAHAASSQDGSLRTLEDMERAMRLSRHRDHLIPTPLSGADLRRWAADLGVGPEHQEPIDLMVNHYDNTVREVHARAMRRLGSLWPASFEYSRDRREVQAIPSPALTETLREHESLMRAILAADQYAVSVIGGLAPPERLPRLRAMQAARLRALLEPLSDWAEDRVDLAELVAAFEPTEPERPAIEPILDQYHVAIIRALTARDYEWAMRRELRAALRELELGVGWEYVLDDESRLRVNRAFEKWRAVGSPTELTLAEINWSFMRRIADTLPRSRSWAFRARFYRQVEPEFFEEETEFHDALSRGLSLLSDRPDEIASLEAEVEAARPRLDRLAEEALTGRRLAPGHDFDHPHALTREQLLLHARDAAETERHALSLRRERRQIMAALVAGLAARISGVRELPHWLEDYRRSLNDRSDADRFRIDGLAARLGQIDGLIAAVREVEIDASTHDRGDGGRDDGR